MLIGILSQDDNTFDEILMASISLSLDLEI